MAFPTLAGEGGGASTASSTSHNVDLTSAGGTPSVGDLLVLCVSSNASLNNLTDAWRIGPLGGRVTGTYVELRSHIVQSGDSTTLTLDFSAGASSNVAWRLFRFSGWYSPGTMRDHIYAGGTATDGCGTNASPVGATGTSTTPDTPSVTPADWTYDKATPVIQWCSSANLDLTWFAIAGWRGAATCSAAPTNYSNLVTSVSTGGSPNVGIAVARRDLAATSEDASTFTLSASVDWSTISYVVRGPSDFPIVKAIRHGNSDGNVTQSDVLVKDANEGAGRAAVGDLVIIVIAKDGTGTFTWPATPAFTALLNSAYQSQLAISVGYRIWQSGDSTTVSLTHATESTAWQVIIIAAGTFDPNKVFSLTATSGSSTNPDPPSHDPGLGIKNTLWIAGAGNDGNVAITAGPTNYGFFSADRVAASTGAGDAIAILESAVASENPGAFTMSSEQWAAFTLGISPPPVPPPFQTSPFMRFPRSTPVRTRRS